MLMMALELYPEPALVITMFVTEPLLICVCAAALWPLVSLNETAGGVVKPLPGAVRFAPTTNPLVTIGLAAADGVLVRL